MEQGRKSLEGTDDDDDVTAFVFLFFRLFVLVVTALLTQGFFYQRK